jgi:hypothetical protein
MSLRKKRFPENGETPLPPHGRLDLEYCEKASEPRLLLSHQIKVEKKRFGEEPDERWS